MRLLLLGIAGALVAAGVLAAVVVKVTGGSSPSPAASFRGNEPPAGITMPSFALRDQSGRLVRTDDLRGKIVVLTFLDSKCTKACPIIAVEIGRAWRLLTPKERRRATAVAISADPRDDTHARVRAFLARNRASAAIRYLVGPVPVMRGLWHRFQILSSLESGNSDIHSAPVRIYGQDLTWLATEHAGEDLSPQNLAHDIRVALARHPS